MRTLSMFSGIGGLDKGLERAGFEVVAQCEINTHCRKVLKKHWPNVPCHDDVSTLDPTKFGTLDAICGGFPCQDVSNAGLRAGISAARSGLYGQLVRCIRMARPRIGILENVAALLARGMGIVLGDLAEIGYDAEWDCVSAYEVGAPHLRERVFIVAHRDGIGGAGSFACSGVGNDGSETSGWAGCEADLLAVVEDPTTESNRVPKPLVCGMDDGFPDWVERVRGLGNAVVPQVAELIGRQIMNRVRSK